MTLDTTVGFDLEAFEAWVSAATPGAWREGPGLGGSQSASVFGGDRRSVIAWGIGSGDNRDLIANAPTDLRALVAEVRKLRAAVQCVREETDWCPVCDGHHTEPHEGCP